MSHQRNIAIIKAISVLLDFITSEDCQMLRSEFNKTAQKNSLPIILERKQEINDVESRYKLYPEVNQVRRLKELVISLDLAPYFEEKSTPISYVSSDLTTLSMFIKSLIQVKILLGFDLKSRKQFWKQYLRSQKNYVYLNHYVGLQSVYSLLDPPDIEESLDVFSLEKKNIVGYIYVKIINIDEKTYIIKGRYVDKIVSSEELNENKSENSYFDEVTIHKSLDSVDMLLQYYKYLNKIASNKTSYKKRSDVCKWHSNKDELIDDKSRICDKCKEVVMWIDLLLKDNKDSILDTCTRYRNDSYIKFKQYIVRKAKQGLKSWDNEYKKEGHQKEVELMVREFERLNQKLKNNPEEINKIENVTILRVYPKIRIRLSKLLKDVLKVDIDNN